MLPQLRAEACQQLVFQLGNLDVFRPQQRFRLSDLRRERGEGRVRERERMRQIERRTERASELESFQHDSIQSCLDCSRLADAGAGARAGERNQMHALIANVIVDAALTRAWRCWGQLTLSPWRRPVASARERAPCSAGADTASLLRCCPAFPRKVLWCRWAGRRRPHGSSPRLVALPPGLFLPCELAS